MKAMTLMSAPQLGQTSGSDSNGRASNSAQSTALTSERLAPGRQAFEPLGEPVPEQEIAVSLDTVSGQNGRRWNVRCPSTGNGRHRGLG
jgi:hypothetical protein